MGLTVLYDEDCGFCRWALAKLLLWDRGRHLRPVALQAREARQALKDMDDDRRMASWHIVNAAGEVRSAADAFPELLRELPGGKPLARAAEAASGPLDHGYRWVAVNRRIPGRLLSEGARRRADERISRRAD